MKKLTKLTQAQVDLMGDVRDEWIKLALHTVGAVWRIDRKTTGEPK